MPNAPIHLAGELLHLDPAGILLWPAQRLLVVADLHLEKASAAARSGHVLPPFDSRVTLDRLKRLLLRYAPQTVIALGDSFHDDGGPARLDAPDLAWIRAMTGRVDWIWVHGNHDPSPPSGLGGRWLPYWRKSGRNGALHFRHQALTKRLTDNEIGEISGHYHPRARVATRTGSVARACFVADGRRIILPAFGAFTGGLDVTEPSICGLFSTVGRVFLLGGHRVSSFTLPHRGAFPNDKVNILAPRALQRFPPTAAGTY